MEKGTATMKRLIFIPLVLLTVTPVNSAAQETLRVSLGDRVRIWDTCTPACRRTVGTVTALRPDSIVIRVLAQPDFQISRADVTLLETIAGHERKTVLGLGLGATVGLVIGIIPAANYESQKTSIFNPDLDFTPLGILLLAAAGGAVIGAVIGSTIAGQERWQAVPLDQLRISVAPGGRFGLGGSVRF